MKAEVNEHYKFDVEVEQDSLKVNGEEILLDSSKNPNPHSSVIYNYKSYDVELISEDRKAKQSVLKINGRIYTVSMQDEYDLLLQKLGMENALSNKVSEVKAPMPGLVLNILVTEGAKVNKGDSLLILEAMKMENVIKSPTQGVVKKILINKGDKIEKNEIMIQFD